MLDKNRNRKSISRIDGKRTTDFRELQQRRRKHITSNPGQVIQAWLVDGVASPDPDYAKRCAQRLMSDYTIDELGEAVYHRCYRVLNCRSNPLLRRVRPAGKPGRMSHGEEKRYRELRLVHDTIQMVEKEGEGIKGRW